MQIGKNRVEKINVNTILVAIGRDANPESFGAKNANITVDKSTHKIIGRDGEIERTNVDHIYALGDVVYNVPELMPVAQKSGRLLAKRLSLRAANE